MLKNLLKHEDYYRFGKIWMDKFQHPEGRYTEITNTLEVPKLDVEIDVSDVEINVDDVAVINVTVPAVLYGQTIYAEVNGKNKSEIVDVYGKTSIP